jgi:protein-S-isoprenylcysteine O-methyltransferase Ste14
MSEDRDKPVWPWIVGTVFVGIFTLAATCMLWIAIKAYRSTVVKVDADGNVHATTTVD